MHDHHDPTDEEHPAQCNFDGDRGEQGKGDGRAAGQEQHQAQRQEPTPMRRDLLANFGEGAFGIGA